MKPWLFSCRVGDPCNDVLGKDIETDDFAIRGWHRMIDLVNYISSFIEARSIGSRDVCDATTYERIRSLATALKATVQWFALDPETRPRFVVEAARYLADGPLDEIVKAPKTVPPNGAPISMRTGPIISRKGGRGAAGRQEEAARMRESVRLFLAPLSQEDLIAHQEAYRSPDSAQIAPDRVLARALAKHFLMRLLSGTFVEILMNKASACTTGTRLLATFPSPLLTN